jgi:hypothetical protein
MSIGGSRTVFVTQDDIEETDKLEGMIEALVSLMWKLRKPQKAEGS